MISYPRTDGINRGRIYVTSDGIPLARVGGVKDKYDKVTFIKYPDTKIYTYDYLKRSDAERESYRKSFSNKIRKEYVQHIAQNNKAELLKAGITEKQIDAMTDKGAIPKGYQVHHILSLDDNGDNSYENLVLIRNVSEHTAITASQNHFSKGMKPGDVKKVDFIVFDDNTVVYPKEDREFKKYRYDELD